jgi:hypothetical protein
MGSTDCGEGASRVKIGIIGAVRDHPSHPYPLEEVYADAGLAEELGVDAGVKSEDVHRSPRLLAIGERRPTLAPA